MERVLIEFIDHYHRPGLTMGSTRDCLARRPWCGCSAAAKWCARIDLAVLAMSTAGPPDEVTQAM